MGNQQRTKNKILAQPIANKLVRPVVQSATRSFMQPKVSFRSLALASNVWHLIVERSGQQIGNTHH
jgi:hypothetical protein